MILIVCVIIGIAASLCAIRVDPNYDPDKFLPDPYHRRNHIFYPPQPERKGLSGETIAADPTGHAVHVDSESWETVMQQNDQPVPPDPKRLSVGTAEQKIAALEQEVARQARLLDEQVVLNGKIALATAPPVVAEAPAEPIAEAPKGLTKK